MCGRRREDYIEYPADAFKQSVPYASLPSARPRLTRDARRVPGARSLRGGARLQRQRDVGALPVTEAVGEVFCLVEVAADEQLEERGVLLALFLAWRIGLRRSSAKH